MIRLVRGFAHAAGLKKYPPAAVPALPSKKQDLRYPKMHPIKMNEPLHEVISYKVPNRPLTPLYQVPVQAQYALFPPFQPPENAKIASVAIIGPPNAGKSMLVNALIGSKVAIVSRKINSTQKSVFAVKTIGETQLVLKDTPGCLSTHGDRTSRLSTIGWEVVKETEKALFVVDAVKRLQKDVCTAAARLQLLLEDRGTRDDVKEAKVEGETEEHTEARALLRRPQIPAALVVNKCDLVADRRKVKWLVNELKEYANFETIFYTSASENYGIDKVLEYIKEAAVIGMWQYHPGQRTNLADIEFVEEILREYLLDRYHDELPYSIVTRTIGWTPYLDGTLRIDQDIFVKSEAQKAILLGKEGRGIERLQGEVQYQLSQAYKRPIQFNPKVKIADGALEQAVKRGEDISEFKHYQPAPRLELDPRNPAKQIRQ